VLDNAVETMPVIYTIFLKKVLYLILNIDTKTKLSFSNLPNLSKIGSKQ